MKRLKLLTLLVMVLVVGSIYGDDSSAQDSDKAEKGTAEDNPIEVKTGIVYSLDGKNTPISYNNEELSSTGTLRVYKYKEGKVDKYIKIDSGSDTNSNSGSIDSTSVKPDFSVPVATSSNTGEDDKVITPESKYYVANVDGKYVFKESTESLGTGWYEIAKEQYSFCEKNQDNKLSIPGSDIGNGFQVTKTSGSKTTTTTIKTEGAGTSSEKTTKTEKISVSGATLTTSYELNKEGKFEVSEVNQVTGIGGVTSIPFASDEWNLKKVKENNQEKAVLTFDGKTGKIDGQVFVYDDNKGAVTQITSDNKKAIVEKIDDEYTITPFDSKGNKLDKIEADDKLAGTIFGNEFGKNPLSEQQKLLAVNYQSVYAALENNRVDFGDIQLDDNGKIVLDEKTIIEVKDGK
ncbi:hypothetical protein GF323_01510, partial [Candidatus Woesearchaeota archaeon]|nr:hypothetical protein [Candidatus Woesearchaeota archaeon]